MSPLEHLKTKPRMWAAAALVTAGLASGAVIGTTLTAGAATNTSTGSAAASTPSGSTGSAGANAPSGSGTAGPGADGNLRPRGPGGCAPLPKRGTVTAVGADSVTIDGTTYSVTAKSDIDKNGEASLSSLAAGDKVTFSTDPSASTPTIAILHAGNESLDRPAGPPPGAGPGSAGQSGGGSTSNSNVAA